MNIISALQRSTIGEYDKAPWNISCKSCFPGKKKREKKKVALKKTVNQTIKIQDAGHQASRVEVICQNKRLNKLLGASLLFYLQWFKTTHRSRVNSVQKRKGT